MTKSKKKIVLLFSGGTCLIDKQGNILAINDKSDIDVWLKQMPELNILAEIEPIFISSENEVITPKLCEKMAEIIANKEKEVGGFIIISKTEQLINTTLSLSFLLQNFQKTIITTASQISGTDFINNKEEIKRLKSKHGGLGLRSNLINAIQALDYNLPTPAIMFGTRLIPATKAIKDNSKDINLFASLDNNYWGRVDFGISIKSGLSYSSHHQKIYKSISANILVIEDIIGVPWFFSADQLKNYQGVIVKLDNSYNLEEQKQKQIAKWKLPVVLYNHKANIDIHNVISISDCTWSVVLIKTMWAIANIKELKHFSSIMKQNIIGEF